MSKYSLKEIKEIALQSRKELSKRNLLDFTHYTFPNYQANWHHKKYCEKLDQFARGEIKKLMVFMPPQHGKSEQCSRRLPAFILGHNPDCRIGLVSYNHVFASKFNKDVQRIINEESYKQLFPSTYLNTKNIRSIVGTYLRNSDEFEVVGRKGCLVSVGVGGGLTGRAIDILIIDDPYKDAQDAWSNRVRQNVMDWYDTVANTRLHNDSQQLITLTRWHENDLAGALLEREKDEWTVVIYPAIKEDSPNDYDPRKSGEALWESKHSLERLLKIKKHNPHVFGSLYQQNPKPAEGLLFPATELNKYKELPSGKIDEIVAIVDVANKGKDYYCMAVVNIYGSSAYLVDVVFTDEPVEKTIPLSVGMIERLNVGILRIESNNGGDIFETMIKEKIQEKSLPVDINSKHTNQNKETKILVASGYIKENIYFKEEYEATSDYAKFMNNLTSYFLKGKNDHDDAPDTLAMLIDYMKSNKSTNILIQRKPMNVTRNL